MNRCKDCGNILEGGYCLNCHEEAFIMDCQNEDPSQTFSSGFIGKAEIQRNQIRKLKKECV